MSVEQARRYLAYWAILARGKRAGEARAREVAENYLAEMNPAEAASLRAEYGLASEGIIAVDRK